ncbi:MAG: transposase [Gammaproteobacteria bacterium]
MPTVNQKRVLLYGEWVEENVLAPAPHRQYVLTLPRLVRHIFVARRRRWLEEICRIAERLLLHAYAEALPGGRPALIVFVQTFGDLVNFNPHLHVLAADGAFLPGGHFVALPRVPASLLAEGFRCTVLDFLVKNGVLSKELRARMLAWRHGGFSAHNEVSVGVDDAEGRKQLAGYMLRAPMSLQKMTYDAATGTVNPGVIRRILEHLGLWAPLATERSPPLGPASWPRYADLPLTYHPVPDIA